MLVDLIDRLRCPNVHADAWLVAAATHMANRHLMEATLGCHECGAEFAVRNGEVWFGEHVEHAPMRVSGDETLRAAALLNLEEHGQYLLEGGWGSLADSLQAMLDITLFLADPPVDEQRGAAGTDASRPTGAHGTLRGVGDRLPLAPSSMHGIALDRTSDARLHDAVRVLRAGGRLLAPAGAMLPAGAYLLARDERHWVAEKRGEVVTLERAARL